LRIDGVIYRVIIGIQASLPNNDIIGDEVTENKEDEPFNRRRYHRCDE